MESTIYIVLIVSLALIAILYVLFNKGASSNDEPERNQDVQRVSNPRGDSSISRYEPPKEGSQRLSQSGYSVKTKDDISWDILPDEFVVFDLETTGLKYHDPVDIVEISAIKVIKETFRQSGKAETYTAIVRPWRGGLNPEAAAINQISQKLIDEEGHEISSAIKEFVDFVGDRLLIAYNVSFDRWFLQRELQDHGISKRYKYECALELARRAFPGLKNHKLTTVASHIGISTQGAHRAMQDCVMALQVYVWSKSKIEAIKAEENDPNANRYTFSSNDEVRGKSIVFTGTFDHISREDAENIAAMSGMIVRKSLSKRTDFFVAGKKPGKKLDQALALNKTPLTEFDFLQIVQFRVIDKLSDERY